MFIRKKYLNRIAIVAVCLLPLLFAANAPAQSRFQAGINFSAGNPQADFERNVDNNGYGLGLDLLFTPGNSILGVGLSGGFLIYGHEKRQEPFSSNIPDVTVDVITENSIAQLFLVTRLQSRQGRIRPYLDVLVGFSYLFTETKIQDEDGDEDIASTTNFDDFAFAYGAGAGVLVRLYDGSKRIPPGGHGLHGVLLDIKSRYLFGGEAEYLKEGSIQRQNEQISFLQNKSKTDLLTFQIGVAFEF